MLVPETYYEVPDALDESCSFCLRNAVEYCAFCGQSVCEACKVERVVDAHLSAVCPGCEEERSL